MDLLNKLAQQHSEWVSMVRSMGCRDDLAEDFVQEMYLKLHKYINDPAKIFYRENEINTYYVYVTLKRLYLDYLKENAKWTRLDEPYESYSMSDGSEAEYALRDALNAIDKEFEDWHWYDKKMLLLYLETDMSMREISKQTNISLSTIHTTIKNGKERLKANCRSSYEAWKEAESAKEIRGLRRYDREDY